MFWVLHEHLRRRVSPWLPTAPSPRTPRVGPVPCGPGCPGTTEAAAPEKRGRLNPSGPT